MTTDGQPSQQHGNQEATQQRLPKDKVARRPQKILASGYVESARVAGAGKGLHPTMDLSRLHCKEDSSPQQENNCNSAQPILHDKKPLVSEESYTLWKKSNEPVDISIQIHQAY